MIGKFSVILNGNYSFPFLIAVTTLRPDIIYLDVLFSVVKKHLILINLLVLVRRTCHTVTRLKLGNTHVFAKRTNNGLKLNFFAVEVGARGYAQYLCVKCLLFGI